MKAGSAVRHLVFPVCLITAGFLVKSPIVAEESKWPPLSGELIERIELLPSERSVVQEKAHQISAESKAELGGSHIVEHWKPLLVVLIGRTENLDRDQAENRYGQVMEVQGLLTQASLEGEEGLLSAAGLEYIRREQVATENLLAYYVRSVMVPDHWELEEYLDWNESWRAQGDAEESSQEPVEAEDSHSLIGHWEADPKSGMFAFAVITSSRLVLIWEEASGSPASKLDLHSYRVGEERIFLSPNDAGLPYLLSEDEDGLETLNFEVRSEEPALVKIEVQLTRMEMPALLRH